MCFYNLHNLAGETWYLSLYRKKSVENKSICADLNTTILLKKRSAYRNMRYVNDSNIKFEFIKPQGICANEDRTIILYKYCSCELFEFIKYISWPKPSFHSAHKQIENQRFELAYPHSFYHLLFLNFSKKNTLTIWILILGTIIFYST